MIKWGHMYEKELEELETVYTNALEDLNEELAQVLPAVLGYMEKFITLNKSIDDIQEKLQDLQNKRSPRCPHTFGCAPISGRIHGCCE